MKDTALFIICDSIFNFTFCGSDKKKYSFI